MRKLGIRGHALFLALAPATVIVAVLLLHFVHSRISDLDQELKERGLAIARQLAPASEYGVFSGNREILQKLVDAAMKEADVKSVVIRGGGGKILAFGGVRGGSSQDDALTFSAPIYLTQTAVDDFDLTPAAAREEARPTALGEVSVQLSRASTVARKNLLIINSLAIAAIGLAASALLALGISRAFTRPILRLAGAVKAMEGGNLKTRVPENSGGELLVLERGINTMAAAIESAHESLEERVAQATAKLAYQASHDALTGLVNRTEFEVRLDRALASTKQYGRVHALCYLDLDQFKVVNDTCGHSAGDELLRQLTMLLKSGVRERDTLARLGGDEFGLLLENCTLEQAYEIAETLRQTVQDFRFVWQGRSFVVGVSIGLVALTPHVESIAMALSIADAACYAAKDKGRNRIQVYEAGDAELARRHVEMHWVSMITGALEEDRFHLYYQPIVPLHTRDGDAHHVEVLLRMKGSDGELIPPMAFLPAAERYNLMPAIDRWVIRSVFSAYRQLAPARRENPCHTCTINLSGTSLGDEQFLDFIRQQFRLYGIPPERICFEITETAAIANLSGAMELIRELKQLGCRFSLDDFGSGLSSFAYLKNLPVDYLKIDGVFVKDMAEDPIDHAMVEAINNIGHVMGIKTIAEYVENEAILEALRDIGVDYVQGYWIQQPLPLLEFSRKGQDLPPAAPHPGSCVPQ